MIALGLGLIEESEGTRVSASGDVLRMIALRSRDPPSGCLEADRARLVRFRDVRGTTHDGHGPASPGQAMYGMTDKGVICAMSFSMGPKYDPPTEPRNPLMWPI